MNTFKFRVLVDATEDVFRDIEISSAQTLQDLYDCIVTAFDFNGGVMAAFYVSNDEWERGAEYTLLDMSESGDAKNTMAKAVLNDLVEEENQKFILVYDFMRMWCFYVELVEEKPIQKNITYPRVVLKFGDSLDENSKEISDDLAFGGLGDLPTDDDLELNDDDDDAEVDEFGDMFNELDGHSEER
jgi:Plasmid pRiA4b ORF-3-like protein